MGGDEDDDGDNLKVGTVAIAMMRIILVTKTSITTASRLLLNASKCEFAWCCSSLVCNGRW